MNTFLKVVVVVYFALWLASSVFWGEWAAVLGCLVPMTVGLCYTIYLDFFKREI